MGKLIKACDLFCGAGGSSTGLAQACSDLGLGLRLLAINHWNVAIDTHSTNHPEAKHLCTGLDSVDPRKAVPGGKLDLLVASPECQHHSIARGGKPINDQSRTSAWLVLRWCEALQIQNVLIENLKEFRTWGPIGTNNRPLKRRKGETFQAFINALRSLGYEVDHRVLNAADFGDPTSRERLFIIGRRGRRQIVWPEATHAPKAVIEQHAQPSLFKRAILTQHRTAREIIDWDIEGQSIFNRKRPLAPNTMNRIFAGLAKYCGIPFIVPNFGERDGQEPRTHAIDSPLPAVTGHGAGALVEPFIVELRNHQDARSIDDPLSAICTSGGHHALCQPYIYQPYVLGQQSQGAPRDVDRPLPTIATDGAIALVEPFLIATGGPRGTQEARPVDKPMRSLLARDQQALIEPFLMNIAHTANPQRNIQSVDAPLATVLTKAEHALVEPYLIRYQGNHNGRTDGDTRTHKVDKPLPNLDTSNRYGLCQPYLVKFYGNGDGAASVDEPLSTVTTKDRFGLCIPQIGAVLDIRFRMLQPHELAAAMGFPRNYVFKGNREQRVKQIGNAVAVNMAAALCKTLIA